MNNFEYKYVFNINVRSARPEEGLREGRNVDSAPMPTYCMRSTIIIQSTKTLDAEEHHEGTEPVRSHNKFVERERERETQQKKKREKEREEVKEKGKEEEKE